MVESTPVVAGEKAPRVSVLVPTFRRPQLLAKTLAGFLAQRDCASSDFEVIVVDNCPDASARPIFDRAVDDAGGRVCLSFLHEPRPGISHARNTALAAARGDGVLFLDDDQEPTPMLIAHYLRAQASTGAPILIGPVEAVFEAGVDEPDADMRAYFSRHYAVPDLSDISDDIARLGTNNAFFDRRICFPDPDPFAPALGLVGGEDTLIFRSLRQRGLRFVWVAEARAYEFVPRQRQTSGYMQLRRFRSGQIRVLTCLRLTPPRVVDAAMWMAIGAAQCAFYLLLSALLRLIGNGRWRHMMGRAYGGAGKVLWMERFRFPAYGATARIGR